MLGRSRSQRYEDDDDERDDLNRYHGGTVLEALCLHDRMSAQQETAVSRAAGRQRLVRLVAWFVGVVVLALLQAIGVDPSA